MTDSAENLASGVMTVTLRSVDDATFELPLAAARLSEMCAQALPEEGSEDDGCNMNSIEPIDILRVRKQVRGISWRGVSCRRRFATS
jgi:hypothetical protein